MCRFKCASEASCIVCLLNLSSSAEASFTKLMCMASNRPERPSPFSAARTMTKGPTHLCSRATTGSSKEGKPTMCERRAQGINVYLSPSLLSKRCVRSESARHVELLSWKGVLPAQDIQFESRLRGMASNFTAMADAFATMPTTTMAEAIVRGNHIDNMQCIWACHARALVARRLRRAHRSVALRVPH